MADKDKSGYIEKSEFEKMTKNLSKEQREKVFAKCDKDGDGKINYSEFSSMMSKKCSVKELVKEAMPKKK